MFTAQIRPRKQHVLKSCRLCGSHPATWAESYHNIRKTSTLKDITYKWETVDLPEVGAPSPHSTHTSSASDRRRNLQQGSHTGLKSHEIFIQPLVFFPRGGITLTRSRYLGPLVFHEGGGIGSRQTKKNERASRNA